MIGWNEENSAMSARLYLMRPVISARMARSMMRGVASSESSHVLCITIVFVPPVTYVAFGTCATCATYEQPVLARVCASRSCSCRLARGERE